MYRFCSNTRRHPRVEGTKSVGSPLIVGDSHMHWLEKYAKTDKKFPNFAISGHGLKPPAFFARRGACLINFTHQRRALTHIRQQKPPIIVAALGGNDLDCEAVASAPKQGSRKIALEILQEIRRWLCVPGVRQIVVCQVLRRKKWRKLTLEQADEAVRHTNEVLKAACAGEQKIFFWEHRGMWKSKFDIFFDDVHFNDKGNEKLLASVRGCILRADNKCKKQ